MAGMRWLLAVALSLPCMGHAQVAGPEVWRITQLQDRYHTENIPRPHVYFELGPRAAPAHFERVTDTGPSFDHPTPTIAIGPVESGAPMTITVVGSRGCRIVQVQAHQPIGECWGDRCTFRDAVLLPEDVVSIWPAYAVEGTHPRMTTEHFRSHGTSLGGGDSESCAGSSARLARSIGAIDGSLQIVCFDDGSLALTHTSPDHNVRTVFMRHGRTIGELPGRFGTALRLGTERRVAMIEGDHMRLMSPPSEQISR
jgi:hypothetical protein